MGGFVAAAAPVVGNLLGGIFGGNAAKKAAKAAADAKIAAAHGIEGATQQGQTLVGAAGNAAPGIVNQATDAANQTLSEAGARQAQNTAGYLQTGTRGNELLQNQNPFSFSLGDWQNDPGFKFQMEQGTNAISNAASRTGLLQSGNTLKDLTKFGQGLASTYYNDAFKRALSSFGANLEQGQTLADIGLRGTNLYQQAEQNASNQIARNTLGAGYYGADTGIDISKFLANFGLKGTGMAADYYSGAGEDTAAGIMGKGAATTGMISGLSNTVPALLKKLGIG